MQFCTLLPTINFTSLKYVFPAADRLRGTRQESRDVSSLADTRSHVQVNTPAVLYREARKASFWPL